MAIDVKTALQLASTITSLLSAATTVVDATGALGTNAPTIRKYLDLLAAMLGEVQVSVERLAALKALVEKMVLEGREPTDDEWQQLYERSQTAHDIIQSEQV